MSGAIPTIAEAARLIAAKRLSPVELTRACLERVHALDNRLHAFVHLTEERALAEARAAETAIMAGGASTTMGTRTSPAGGRSRPGVVVGYSAARVRRGRGGPRPPVAARRRGDTESGRGGNPDRACRRRRRGRSA